MEQITIEEAATFFEELRTAMQSLIDKRITIMQCWIQLEELCRTEKMQRLIEAALTEPAYAEAFTSYEYAFAQIGLPPPWKQRAEFNTLETESVKALYRAIVIKNEMEQ